MIRVLVLACIILPGWTANSQSSSGKVVDAETGSGVPKAVVAIGVDSTITDEKGHFGYEIGQTINIQHVGYESSTFITEEGNQTFLLQPKTYALDGVVVNDLVAKVSQEKAPLPYYRLSRKEINQFDPVSIQNALNTVPGVFMQSGALNTNRIAIRGIGSRSPFSTNKIRAYYGEIPLTNGTGETTIEDLDLQLLGRAEIIKGPSSSTFGSGLGGAILLQPNRAAVSSVGISSTFGSFGLAKNDLNLSLRSENSQNRLFYSNLNSDGYRDNNELEREAVAFFSDTYTNKSEHHLIAYYLSQKAFIPSSLNEETFNDSPTDAAFTWGQSLGNEDYERVLIGYSHGLDLNQKLTSKTAVFGSFFQNDEDRPFNILKEQVFGSGFRQRFIVDLDQIEVVAGGELFFDRYEWSTTDNLYQTFLGQGSVEGDLIQSNKESRSYYNLFAEAKWTIGNTLISGGFNFNETTYELQNIFGANNTSGNYTYDPIFNPKIGVSHTLGRSVIFASWSHGFSTPSLEETLNPDGSLNTNISPETGRSAELGYRFLGSTFHAEIIGYQMNINDLLVARRTAEDAFIGINAGSTSHLGLESKIYKSFTLTKNFKAEINTTLALNRFRFNEFLDGDNDFSGNQLTGFPSQNFSAQGNLQYLGKGQLTITYQAVSEIPVDDANSLFSEGYGLLFTKISWTEKLWKQFELAVSGGINNLLDEKYASMIAVNSRGFGGNAPRYFYPGLPRNGFGTISLNYSFGK